MKQVICVDLYCGIGGATQGMINAGAKVVLSIDLWEVAEAFHTHNYPEVPFVMRRLNEDVEGDIEIILDALKEYSDKNKYHIHIHGSPPCQGLSVPNVDKQYHSIESAMKNVNGFVEMVGTLMQMGFCDSWSLENVPPTAKHMPDGLFYQILDASEHGVSQTRKRYFGGYGWMAQKQGGETLTWDAFLGEDDLPEESYFSACGNTISMSKMTERHQIRKGRVCCTLRRQKPSIRIKAEDGSYSLHRRITNEEKMAFFGFPEEKISIPKGLKEADVGLAIGNSVCPPVMEAIIKGINFQTWL